MANTKKNLNMVSIVSVQDAINRLMTCESKYIPVATVCKQFQDKLNSGYCGEQLCESFIAELSKVAEHDAAKSVLFDINEAYKLHKRDVEIVKNLCSLKESQYAYVVPTIESVLVEYMVNKTPETRSAARNVMSLFESVSEIQKINECLAYDEYDTNSGRKIYNVKLNESAEEAPRTYTAEEVDKILEEKLAAQKDELSSRKITRTIKDVDSHINLTESISNILRSCKDNEKLKVFCEQYTNALNAGKSDEVLLESFISGISNWNYLSAVDTEVSALKDRVSKYRQEVDIKKIIETMKETSSYFIVPLIEDMVVEYLNNKSMQNRAVLTNRLHAFDYDPYVRDIVLAVTRDQSKESNVYLGESIEGKNPYVHTEEIYSPVEYIKENECVFNVKGSFYAKKGSSISKFSKKDVASLSESFKSLCRLVNSDDIRINEADDSISLYNGSNSAVISESALSVNGTQCTNEEFESIARLSSMMNEGNEKFYNDVRLLNENFGSIAKIDFVKRVASNDGACSVDVFKLKNNLFVNTVNESLGTSTFYRNVNPIQCKNYINEHMMVNVTSLFEDMLPNQEETEREIEETKKQYSDYIEKLRTQKEEFENMKAEGANTEDIDAAIKSIDDELASVEADFKKYQDDSDKDTKIEGADKGNEPDPAEEPEEPEDGERVDDKEGDETETQMEVPVTEDPEFENVEEFDPTFDTVSTSEDASFQVVKVSYNENVKTGRKSGKGDVFVIIPSVNANGDICNETKKITFYLTADRTPVINNEYMPLDMYYAIKNAIESDPATQTVDIDETPETPEDPDGTAVSTPIDADAEGDASVSDTFAAGLDGMGVPADAASETVADTATEGDPEAPVETEEPVEEPVPAAEEETPAETAEKESEYPVTVGLAIRDIKPISQETFECALNDMGIKHSQKEGCDGNISFTISNKAEAHALKDYFNEWKGYNTKMFCNFFPELKKCFANKQTTIPVMGESVSIKNVFAVNESKLYADDKKGRVKLVLPNTKDYRSMFGLNENKKASTIELTTDSFEETREIYEKLAEYNYTHAETIDEDAKSFLSRYAFDFKDINEQYNATSVNVPYNNFLAQKLAGNGIRAIYEGETMSVQVRNGEEKRAIRVFESFYKGKYPTAVKDLLEAVKITIKDDTTGKTVEIDTSALNDGETKEGEDESANFDSSFKDVTFGSDNALYSDDDKDSDEGEKNDEEKDEKKDESNKKDEEVKESEETPEASEESDSKKESDDEKEPEEKDEDKPKKKFKFRLKKKSNESVESKTVAEILNESAVNVYDNVKLSNGKKGQIISQFPNGNYIVSVEGHTVECSESELSLVDAKRDTVPAPFKYDEKTLKGLYEQMVHCGMFMNENQITPSNCFTNYAAYMNASNDSDVTIVIEGENVLVNKKYIRILENVNDFANINDYVPATILSEGQQVSALANRNDAYGSTCRVLLNEGNQCKLRSVSTALVTFAK